MTVQLCLKKPRQIRTLLFPKKPAKYWNCKLDGSNHRMFPLVHLTRFHSNIQPIGITRETTSGSSGRSRTREEKRRAETTSKCGQQSQQVQQPPRLGQACATSSGVCGEVGAEVGRVEQGQRLQLEGCRCLANQHARPAPYVYPARDGGMHGTSSVVHERGPARPRQAVHELAIHAVQRDNSALNQKTAAPTALLKVAGDKCTRLVPT